MSIHDPARIECVDFPTTDKAVAECVRSIRDVRRELGFQVLTVTLPNATLVKTKHGLGRKAQFVSIGLMKGATAAGYINKTTPTDGTDDIWLTATGFGATITLTIKVE